MFRHIRSIALVLSVAVGITLLTSCGGSEILTGPTSGEGVNVAADASFALARGAPADLSAAAAAASAVTWSISDPTASAWLQGQRMTLVSQKAALDNAAKTTASRWKAVDRVTQQDVLKLLGTCGATTVSILAIQSGIPVLIFTGSYGLEKSFPACIRTGLNYTVKNGFEFGRVIGALLDEQVASIPVQLTTQTIAAFRTTVRASSPVSVNTPSTTSSKNGASLKLSGRCSASSVPASFPKIPMQIYVQSARQRISVSASCDKGVWSISTVSIATSTEFSVYAVATNGKVVTVSHPHEKGL